MKVLGKEKKNIQVTIQDRCYTGLGAESTPKPTWLGAGGGVP